MPQGIEEKHETDDVFRIRRLFDNLDICRIRVTIFPDNSTFGIRYAENGIVNIAEIRVDVPNKLRVALKTNLLQYANEILVVAVIFFFDKPDCF